MLLKLNRLFKLFHLYSNTYEKIQKHSDSVWKNQRYHQIYEYIDSHVLPPPLNLLIFLAHQACKFLHVPSS